MHNTQFLSREPEREPAPAPEIGSPRYMRDRCANALAVHRKLGKAALFITMTTDLKDWPEVWTRLPVFNGAQQDPFDRAAIHSEVPATLCGRPSLRRAARFSPLPLALPARPHRAAPPSRRRCSSTSCSRCSRG